MICKKIYLDESAYLDVYVADKIEGCERKALLIIPGGGYGFVCSAREGEPIAHAFMPYGFNAFVLHYSVAGEKTFPAQLIQASKAMKHIKDNAEEYGILKDEVFAVGFSAGGHLCASLGVMWNKKEIYDEIDMPYGYNKPKGIMLMYPVISGVSEFAHMGSFYNLFASENPSEDQLKSASIELYVNDEVCPAYIVHAANDTCVPVENSLILAMEYSKINIPFEMHIYPNGAHGFGLGNKITWCGYEESAGDNISQWVDDAVRWTNRV